MDVFIPADVTTANHSTFEQNYRALTHNTNKLFLFAADQKIEHLNADFFGKNIDPQANLPQHIFDIAHSAPIDALAIPLGFCARYAAHYPHINYVIKLNGKTNLISSAQQDPFSELLWTVDDVVALKKNCQTICAVGYTLYLGSTYESLMLKQAAQISFQAHQHGLPALLWVYPRGKAITKYAPELFAGAAGIAHALGADFVKLSIPEKTTYQQLLPAIEAAGNTKILCAGGPLLEIETLLHEITQQQQSGFAGVAIGRNLFQRSLNQAQKLAQSIANIIHK